MSRLYDRILARGVVPVAHTPFENRSAASLADIIRTADPVVFAVDNVAAYQLGSAGKEEWDLRKDFPNLAPPFRSLFLETRAPAEVIDPTSGKVLSRRDLRLPHSWGVLLLSWDADPETLGGEDDRWSQAVRDARWEVLGILYVEPSKGEIHGPVGTTRFWVNEDGSLAAPEGEPLMLTGTKTEIGGQSYWGNEAQIQWLLNPFLLAITFLHCKNVTRRAESPPGKLSAKHQKKHGRPLVRYHTLEIGPVREILRHEGRSEESGLKQALHICRGHFATYGVEGKGKLFGRHSGTFWVPQHLRGNKKEGVVLKDYQVEPPGGTA